ncbi:MAG: aminotransferase class V-fold PLP-dependent enzyme, partial [Candidatus Puniceispirillaceae bacterium]
LEYGTRLLSEIDGLNIVGTATHKASILSFHIDVIHPLDVVTLLDQDGIAVRGGHHCAQPLMDFYDIPSTARASVGVYTTREDFDRLAIALEKVNRIFA